MRVALYVRVSTDRQQQTQTIEQQVAQLHSYVAAHAGWTVAAGHVFRDDGRSGARLDRPGLDALRDQAARAAFDLVVVCSPVGWLATSCTRWWSWRNWSAAACG